MRTGLSLPLLRHRGALTSAASCPHPRLPQDLTRFVRSKAHPKRSLASFQWRLGPRDDDPHLAVKLYALTLPQKLPAVGGGTGTACQRGCAPGRRA